MGLGVKRAQYVLARRRSVLQQIIENMNVVQTKLNIVTCFYDELATQRDAYAEELQNVTTVLNDSAKNVAMAREITEEAQSAYARRMDETNAARSEFERLSQERASIERESGEIGERFQNAANKLENLSESDVRTLLLYQDAVEEYLSLR